MNITIMLTTALLIMVNIILNITAKTFNLKLSSSNEWEILPYINMDQITSSFISTIIIISASVSIFSTFYIEEENNKNEFNILTIMFVGSILLMVLSPSLVSIMVGWDGLGLTSFCLVIFYQNQISLASSLITVYSNRLGDIAILCIITTTKETSWTNSQKFGMTKTLLITAALTNSAQLPFSAWLPAAIAAPTPTSSLVHSSTLVTAGVWLVNRFNTSLKYTITNNALILAALSTTILAGLTATNESDIKKIVAMSTLSQLGIIMMTSSILIKSLTILHTNTHALFNALLFITVGSMIENSEGVQNKNSLSAQESNSSISSLNTATITLISLPITSSFFSSDLILESMIENTNTTEITIMMSTAILTTVYSIIIIVELAKKKKSSESNESHTSKGEIVIVATITALSTTIYSTTELQVSVTSQSENIVWLMILLAALNTNENNGNESNNKKENLLILSSVTSKEASKKKSNYQNSDKNWLNKATVIISNGINSLNEEKNKNIKKALVLSVSVAVLIIK